MAISGITELANRIPEMWAPKMYAELRNGLILANKFDTGYTGDLKFGDTVNVQTLAAPTGEVLTDDEATFAVDTMSVLNKAIIVNKRASAAFDISDLAQLQSLSFEQEVQAALVFAVRKQLEGGLIAALVPSAAAPDHLIGPAAVSALAAVDLATMRTLLSVQKVPVEGRVLILDPNYYGDLMVSTQIMSRDFTAGNSAQSGVVDSFVGFQVMEHNLLGTDVGFAFHPSCLQLVMQQDIRIKISDLHSTGKYAYRVSADMVYGYTLFDANRMVKIVG